MTKIFKHIIFRNIVLSIYFACLSNTYTKKRAAVFWKKSKYLNTSFSEKTVWENM